MSNLNDYKLCTVCVYRMKQIEYVLFTFILLIGCVSLYLHIQLTNHKNISKIRKKSLEKPNLYVSKIRKKSLEKPNLYVLTTGVRHFQSPVAFTTTTVHSRTQTATVGPTFDEGYGPQQWPEGAKRVVDGHVTVWRRIAAECSDWCFVSEDDAIWPSGLPPTLPLEGFVSFYKEAVCLKAWGNRTKEYARIVRTVIPGKCMPYGAVAYAMTGDFAKVLLSNLPMSKPVDHFLWEQAVVQKKAYVSRQYIVRHKKGKSLRQNTVQHPPPNADPQTPHHTIIDDADRANSSDMPNIEHFTVQHPPPNADNPAFTLLQNEGSHKQFDKTWSKYNKFLTDKGFLKIGTDNVAHEWLYWSLAMALNATELFIGVPSVVSICDDASVLTSQLQTPPEFKLPLYGILVKYEPSVKRGWSQTKHCQNLQSQRVLKMLFIDYLVGHSDRPSNCHTISGKVYAIDNDGVTITPKLQDWNNGIQANILHRALKDENYKAQILQKIKPYLTLPFDVDALRNNMKETFHCSMDMHKHFETLISSVIFRLNHLKYLQNKSEGIDSVSIGKLKDVTNSHNTSIIRPMLKKIKLSDLASAKSSDQKGQKCSFPEWIVFAGDSNMRHTYHYWISTIKGYHKQTKSHTFAIDSGGNQQVRWADQETILEFENNCILRASFRFLHGSTSEFIHVFTHWHEFRKYEPFEDQDPNKFNPQNGLVVNKNTVRPSDYALMTTQKGIAIDCQVSNPLLCSKLKQFQNKKPSWVFLTEGWGGVPYCSWFHEATEIMSRYPSINFIWAPIYVTNNNEQRYDCFKRISNNFQPDIDNLKMLDFWDISSKKLPKHTAVGGTHMRTAIKRFSDVWKSSDMPNIENFPKIAVAIPTYNRRGYVQLCAVALNKSIDPNDVWIFDDHSSDYSIDDLKKWFHTENVQQNTERQKADKQGRHILEWFITTDYDWLVTLDSDLIVRPDWLELLRGMLPRTQGVMSLYHSGNSNHPTLTCGNSLCEMQSLGNAGIVWSKVLAKRMLLDMTQSNGFDWGWTEWLRQQKIPQYAAKDSLVLHVGMHGTWGADSKREKSVGFPMEKLSPDVRGRAEMFLKGMSPDVRGRAEMFLKGMQ